MAAAVAAMVAKTRREIVAHFDGMGAMSAETAVAFAPEQPMARRLLGQMVRQGSVVEVTPGVYYLDRAALDAWRRSSMSRVMILLVVGALTVALVVLLTRNGS